MTEEEISELYARLVFLYESAIDTLLAKRVIDTDLATTAKEKFYDSLGNKTFPLHLGSFLAAV